MDRHPMAADLDPAYGGEMGMHRKKPPWASPERIAQCKRHRPSQSIDLTTGTLDGRLGCWFCGADLGVAEREPMTRHTLDSDNEADVAALDAALDAQQDELTLPEIRAAGSISAARRARFFAALPASPAPLIDWERLAWALNETVGHGWLRATPPDPVAEWRVNANAIADAYERAP